MNTTCYARILTTQSPQKPKKTNSWSKWRE